MFAFFAACIGGTIMPLPGVLDGGAAGLAGNFPFGCFDAQGQQLPAGNFVPGYTEVFAFADGRTHTNPVIDDIRVDPIVNRIVDDASVPDGGNVNACSVPEQSRLGPTGCGNPNPGKLCEAEQALYQITVDVPDNATMEAGAHAPYETVWVDYFADQGDIKPSTQLISDSDGTLHPSFSTQWIASPAPEAGTLAVNIWAVVHRQPGRRVGRSRRPSRALTP